MERCILYTENGDNYLGDNYSVSEAKKYLKKHGYAIAYSGRKFTANGTKVIVGIDGQNRVNLSERRKNGLYRATHIVL